MDGIIVQEVIIYKLGSEPRCEGADTLIELSVREDKLLLEVKGWDKLWAFKGSLEIPLEHIKSVRTDTKTAHAWWKGIRLLGTHVPGVISAGTFYQDGRRIFWDVHNPDRTIVVDLEGEHYDQLVIEVTEPDAAVSLIQGAIKT